MPRRFSLFDELFVGGNLNGASMLHDDHAVGSLGVERRCAIVTTVRPAATAASAARTAASVAGRGSRSPVEHDHGRVRERDTRDADQLPLAGGSRSPRV